MGFLTNFFGKKASGMKQEMAKVENRDLMQAIVGGALLVAYADGDCEDSEVSKMEAVIASLPELSHFGGEISDTIGTFRAQLDAGFRIGKQRILKEISEIKGSDDDRQLVFNVMLTIAEADGTVAPEETAVLKEVGQRLGLNLRDYGIE